MADSSPTPGLEPAGQAPPGAPDGKPTAGEGISVTPTSELDPAPQAPGPTPDPSSP